MNNCINKVSNFLYFRYFRRSNKQFINHGIASLLLCTSAFLYHHRSFYLPLTLKFFRFPNQQNRKFRLVAQPFRFYICGNFNIYYCLLKNGLLVSRGTLPEICCNFSLPISVLALCPHPIGPPLVSHSEV